VNGVLWAESDSLLQLGSADESYAVRIQDNGTTEITFGDGVRGSRIPSGAENVVATYRSGLGVEGEVEANQLALLKTKPLGIREVTNPLPATGAAAPESEAEARENAPLTVLVLGRVVSVQDYEDFSKTFPGVGKAQAVSMWDGFRDLVHLTIGTAGGAPIIPGSPLYENLLGALDNVRDTHQIVLVEGYEARYFGLAAKIRVDERYEPEPLLNAIGQRLHERFSYAAREFGQDVTAAEIIAAVHEIAGVIAVDLDTLEFVDPVMAAEPDEPAATQRLEARLARMENGKPRPAELLLLDSSHVDLKVMT
jgi:predicted phage baseplate assembly protein